MTEINISEPETIAGVPPIIVSGMEMSVSGPEMIIGVSPMMISLTETIVSLTELTVGATMMTVWDSSMAVDDTEIIVNETELIAYERPFGTPLRDVYNAAGGLKNGKTLKAILPGGPSCAFLRSDPIRRSSISFRKFSILTAAKVSAPSSPCPVRPS